MLIPNLNCLFFFSVTAVVSPDAIVCDGVTLEGDITIGPRCVVHPKAVIIAKDGPIVFGEGNLIEEYSRIVSRCGISISLAILL